MQVTWPLMSSTGASSRLRVAKPSCQSSTMGSNRLSARTSGTISGTPAVATAPVMPTMRQNFMNTSGRSASCQVSCERFQSTDKTSHRRALTASAANRSTVWRRTASCFCDIIMGKSSSSTRRVDVTTVVACFKLLAACVTWWNLARHPPTREDSRESAALSSVENTPALLLTSKNSPITSPEASSPLNIGLNMADVMALSTTRMDWNSCWRAGETGDLKTNCCFVRKASFISPARGMVRSCVPPSRADSLGVVVNL
mmetsp:Transcript_8527/g.19627  ORF Transcript_8527/g.19627 Transcript_8527/m.19627 type:complete len:257 (-) Transcript_8527:2351-3121(-)